MIHSLLHATGRSSEPPPSRSGAHPHPRRLDRRLRKEGSPRRLHGRRRGVLGGLEGLAYFYFKSKDEILVYALKERVAHLFDVGAALDALLTNVLKDPDLFRLYLALSLETSLSKTAASALRELGAPLERYLGAVRGVFEDLGSADPELDALLFRSALLGVFLRFVRAIEEVPIERLCEGLVEIFLGRRAGAARRH